MAALYRVVIGVLFLPALMAVSGDLVSGWGLFAAFAVLLAGLRIVPAVIRTLLPFPAPVRAAWSQRRDIAKSYDSYQWQKLFWMGLGLAAYLIVQGEFAPQPLALTATCLVAGAFGLLTWRTRRPRTAA